jgi:hypothetical protein
MDLAHAPHDVVARVTAHMAVRDRARLRSASGAVRAAMPAVGCVVELLRRRLASGKPSGIAERVVLALPYRDRARLRCVSKALGVGLPYPCLMEHSRRWARKRADRALRRAAERARRVALTPAERLAEDKHRAVMRELREHAAAQEHLRTQLALKAARVAKATAKANEEEKRWAELGWL